MEIEASKLEKDLEDSLKPEEHLEAHHKVEGKLEVIIQFFVFKTN